MHNQSVGGNRHKGETPKERKTGAESVYSASHT